MGENAQIHTDMHAAHNRYLSGAGSDPPQKTSTKDGRDGRIAAHAQVLGSLEVQARLLTGC